MRFVSCDFPGRVRGSVIFGCTAIKKLCIGCILGFGAEANKLYYFGDFTAEMQFPMGLRNEPFMLALTKSTFRLDTAAKIPFLHAYRGRA